MTEEEYEAAKNRLKVLPKVTTSDHAAVIASYSAPKVPKPSKYKNKKVVVDGITFDSSKEANRYVYLKLSEGDGVISALMLQPVFELAPAVTLDGRKKPALRYIGDFRYYKNGVCIVEDVKSKHTSTLPVYRIKKHLLKHLFNIDITEV